MLNKFIVIMLIISFTSCSESNTTDVPFSANINIKVDGLLHAKEWKRSRTIQLTPKNFLYLIQNRDYLFVGINNNENIRRYVDLYIDNDSIGTVNLHASMQLGERQLIGSWNDTIPSWNWGNNIDWTANTVEIVNEDEGISFQESVRLYEGHEFQISKEKIRSKQVKIRLEIKDFVGQASDLLFPINSKRNSTENWLNIEVK